MAIRTRLVPGVPFAPDSARRLLAEAGYPDGRGFPPLQLQVNADGFGYVRVAEAVQAMLERELRVPVSISVLPADKHYERVEMMQARFWREGWTADHPDPENFLSLLYGKNAVLGYHATGLHQQHAVPLRAVRRAVRQGGTGHGQRRTHEADWPIAEAHGDGADADRSALP